MQEKGLAVVGWDGIELWYLRIDGCYHLIVWNNDGLILREGGQGELTTGWLLHTGQQQSRLALLRALEGEKWRQAIRPAELLRRTTFATARILHSVAGERTDPGRNASSCETEGEEREKGHNGWIAEQEIKE